jgi:hypothetical protein
MLSSAGLASDVAIGKAFDRHRNTVGRLARRLATDGLAAVVPAKRGPKGRHKVTADVLKVIEVESRQMSAAALAHLVAERTGVVLSVSHVRRLAAAYKPVQTEFSELEQPGEVARELPAADVEIPGPAAEAELPEEALQVAQGDEALDERPNAECASRGGAITRSELASGEQSAVSFDPPAVPPALARGRYMGLALYFPAISALGVDDVARKIFSLPRSVTFGVRAVTLSLLFMTLLKKPTLESAKHLRRAEFGALIGTERAPCVKTLRRKLDALVSQQKATEFGTLLARRWVEAGVVATDYLYVDGHMKVYAGKRRLQEFYNSKRRVVLPGVHSYFVGDSDGRPLLVLAEELTANLANAMPDIVAAIRDVIGKQRFTLVFDRGGFDGKLFKWLGEQRIGFITYQRGEPKLSDSAFSRRGTRFEGGWVRFSLAEDTAWVNGRGPWRRIVLRAKDGHQTPILTNLGRELRSPRIACLMVARWRQENLFKYMGAHFGLDQLISYGVDPAEPGAFIPNPERRLLEREIAELRQQAAKLKAALGDAVLEKDRGRSIRGLKTAQRGAVGRLRALEAEIGRGVARRDALPKKVTVAESGIGREVLRGEHKAIVDRIKITAYNAEEWLLERLNRHYSNPNDVRDLLRSFAELSGEIRTNSRVAIVTLDAADTPIHRRALRGLIADLNIIGATYPGTDIPVTYRMRASIRT